jgi:hypothetical protein
LSSNPWVQRDIQVGDIVRVKDIELTRNSSYFFNRYIREGYPNRFTVLEIRDRHMGKNAILVTKELREKYSYRGYYIHRYELVV